MEPYTCYGFSPHYAFGDGEGVGDGDGELDGNGFGNGDADGQCLDPTSGTGFGEDGDPDRYESSRYWSYASGGGYGALDGCVNNHLSGNGTGEGYSNGHQFVDTESGLLGCGEGDRYHNGRLTLFGMGIDEDLHYLLMPLTVENLAFASLLQLCSSSQQYNEIIGILELRRESGSHTLGTPLA